MQDKFTDVASLDIHIEICISNLGGNMWFFSKTLFLSQTVSCTQLGPKLNKKVFFNFNLDTFDSKLRVLSFSTTADLKK